MFNDGDGGNEGLGWVEKGIEPYFLFLFFLFFNFMFLSFFKKTLYKNNCINLKVN